MSQSLLALYRLLRSIVRGLVFVALLLAACVDHKIRHPQWGAEGAVWIHRWCRRIVRVMGFQCVVEGVIPCGGAVVSNHLSYLDILMYSAAQPFVMVAKSEVRGWPLMGWLTWQAGTVYVERGGGSKTYPAVNAAMAEAYRSGLPVLFFPEGTTTDGDEVLPFRRGLFHSVLNECVPLRVAALRYSLGEYAVNATASVAEDVCWWGDMAFMPHLFHLLGLKGLLARMNFGDEILAREDRFVLSETAREQVAEIYGELAGVGCVASAWQNNAELAQVL